MTMLQWHTQISTPIKVDVVEITCNSNLNHNEPTNDKTLAESDTVDHCLKVDAHADNIKIADPPIQIKMSNGAIEKAHIRVSSEFRASQEH